MRQTVNGTKESSKYLWLSDGRGLDSCDTDHPNYSPLKIQYIELLDSFFRLCNISSMITCYILSNYLPIINSHPNCSFFQISFNFYLRIYFELTLTLSLTWTSTSKFRANPDLLNNVIPLEIKDSSDRYKKNFVRRCREYYLRNNELVKLK